VKSPAIWYDGLMRMKIVSWVTEFKAI
jgi:hypothetical protein